MRTEDMRREIALLKQRVAVLMDQRDRLAARLAAWEPVVMAACEWADEEEGVSSEDNIYHTVRQMPKEHRP